MSIEALVEAINAARRRSDGLNIIDPEWDDAMATELRLAADLRHVLLQDPIVKTSDPLTRKILPGIDLAECCDPYKAGMGLLFDQIRPEDYLVGLAESGILLLPIGLQIPEHLRSFFDEARQCYALGRFIAVQSMCRTILETTVNEVGVLAGEWTKKQLYTPRFRKAYAFKDKVGLVAGTASPKICELYTDLCSVVHGETTSAIDGALGSLTKTISFVQHLYDLHKDQS